MACFSVVMLFSDGKGRSKPGKRTIFNQIKLLSCVAKKKKKDTILEYRKINTAELIQYDWRLQIRGKKYR